MGWFLQKRIFGRALTQCLCRANRSGGAVFRLPLRRSAPNQAAMKAFLRLDWLGTDRIVGYSRAIALLYVPVLAFLLLVSAGVVSIPSDHTQTDFVSFWAAAKLILAGGSPYDQAALYALQGPSKYAFLYPPPFLFPILPFGALPYSTGLFAWVIAGIAIFFMAARKLSPSPWPVLAMPALLVNAADGQNGALTGALFVGAALTIEKRPFIAGLLLGCFIVKPHLALMFPFAFLFGRQWQVIAGGIVSVLFWVLASTLAFGPDIWPGFMAKSAEASALLADNAMLHPKMASLYGMIRAPGGSLALAYAAQALSALIAAACVAYAWTRRDAAFGMAVLGAGAVLTTPFIYAYDFVLLIVPLVWLARDGMARGFAPWVKLAMVVAFWMPLVDRVFGANIGVNPAYLANAALMAALFYQRNWRGMAGT